MKLYDMTKAPNPRRVRMFLAEKGIEIDRIEMNIAAGDNLTPEFLAINPRGLLPTLVLDDGQVLDESIAICRYFEALQPEPNLFGTSPLESAIIEQWQRRIELSGMAAVGMVFRNSAPHFANHVVAGDVPAIPQLPALVEQGTILTQHFFRRLNDHLGHQPFVAGHRFTVADITGFISLDFSKWVKLFPGEDMPHLLAWYARIKERPSAKA